MIFIDFPIIGSLRFPLLIIEWLIFSFSLELSVVFLLRYNKQSAKLNKEELGYFFLFLSFSLMILFFIKSDYYSSDLLISPFLMWSIGSERDIFLNFGYMSLLIGALFFTFFIERAKNFFKIRYFFSICFLILSIIFFIIFYTDLTITTYFTLIFWPISLIVFINYLVDFVKKAANKNKIKSTIIKYLISFFFLPIGFFFTADVSIDTFGLGVRIFGNILISISLFAIFLIFTRLPSLTEINWKNDVDEIFIINKEGACLFYKPFKVSASDLDKNLVSSAITSVQIMIKEMTSAKETGISKIKKGEKIINIYSSYLLTAVVISGNELRNISYYLRELTLRLERIYFKILNNWDGDLDIFAPIEGIINDTFSL